MQKHRVSKEAVEDGSSSVHLIASSPWLTMPGDSVRSKCVQQDKALKQQTNSALVYHDV